MFAFQIEYSGFQFEAPIIPRIIGPCQGLFARGFHLCCIFAQLAQLAKSCYNSGMATKYTEKQIIEFMNFCKKHCIKFNSMVEFNSAITQYFKD